MRGRQSSQSLMFQYVSVSLEDRVPTDHPLRGIRVLADEALRGLRREFSGLYSHTGRPSIPPEQLLRALLLQSLYSIRSERQLVEQIAYNLLFRWFIGLELEEMPWNHSTFSQNRERFLGKGIAERFQRELLKIADAEGLLSRDHFTVDGTMIQASASLKSFVPKENKGADHAPPTGSGTGGNPDDAGSESHSDPGNPDVDFHGQRRRNDTHGSTTDPEARLYRKGKGKEAQLCYLGHVLMENRHGLIVDSCLTQATGTAEREAAMTMVSRLRRRLDRLRTTQRPMTLGADKGYDTKAFIEQLREQKVTPHIACKTTTCLDQRTLRHPGYSISQRKRKLVEENFGWMKTIGGLRQTRFRGIERIGMAFTLGACAYNILRIAKLQMAT